MLKSKLLIKSISAITILYLLCSFFIVIFALPKIENTVHTLEKQIAKDTLNNIVLLTKSSMDDLEVYSQNSVNMHKEELKAKTNIIWNYIDAKYKNIGIEGTSEELKKEVIEELKIFQVKDDYFYLIDYNYVLISHPHAQGLDASNSTDIKGNYSIRNMVDNAKRDGDSFHRFWYYKTNKRTDKSYEKLSYTKNFPKWNMVLGTGISIWDIEENARNRKIEILNKLEDIVKTTKIGKNGYLTILNKKGMILFDAHKTQFSKDKMYSELIKVNNSNKEFHYKENELVEIGNKNYDKISWVKYLPKLQVYAVASVYLKEIKESSSILHKQIIYVGIIFLILAIVLSTIFLRRFLNPIVSLSKMASLVAKGDFSIRAKINSDDELSGLGKDFNIMVETIEEYMQTLDQKVEEKTNELMIQEQTFKLLFDTAPILIDSFDKNGKCVLWNNECEKVFGWSMNDINNSANPLALFYNDPKIQEDAINTMLTKPEKVFRQWHQLNKKGRTLTTMWAHIYLSNGEVINVGYDITKLKENEKLFAQQSKLASMGEMIGNIAHQWRQPLSIISTAATGMELQKEYGLLSDKEFIKGCTSINKNAQYLSKTIEDFRNYIDSDTIKAIFSIEGNIKNFLNLIGDASLEHDINIIVDIKEDIKIDGYENELIQCLINIFNNAKDILKEKEIKNKLLFITAVKLDDKVIIKVRDNAGGIPSDILPKIFEPYFTTKHKAQATGLGLHTTYNLITDSMNGTIEANNVNYTYKNEEYVGASFTISLPIK